MASDYDLIVVGGGIAGSTLAGRVAAAGRRVLVLERERAFRDRVRGEWVPPWGVVELEKLGIIETLRERADAHDLPLHHSGVYQLAEHPRDIVKTTSQTRAALTFFHPNAQEALLTWAAEEGAEVIRGARVRRVAQGEGDARPAVTWGDEGGEAEARLVVGADGRNSLVRRVLDREEQTRGDDRLWAGALLTGLDWPSDCALWLVDPNTGYLGSVFPLGGDAARVYLGFKGEQRARLSGERDIDVFLETLTELLEGRDIFASATLAGPLATFDADMRWVERPYENGVALIGDAAGYTDPTWGQGLSLGFRDARVLSEALAADEDWDAAAAAYAIEHDRYFGTTVTAESWIDEVLLSPGAEGDATRARVLEAWRKDRSRDPDGMFNGPDFVADDQARSRYFALDLV
ncbi:MAG: NAD(P)/FAD-dependent oxidoreductase [Dehalococcoidia bacterium]